MQANYKFIGSDTEKNVHLENRSLSLAGVRLGSSLGRRLSDLLLLLVLDGRGGHLLLLVAVTSLAKLVDTLVVNLVLPALVEPDEEDDVVTESSQAVEPGHLDSEGEQVVDEGVEELVGHGLAGHVGNGLQSVVDVQTGHHHEEAIGVDTTHESLDDVRVPGLVGVVDQAVSGVGEQKGHGYDVQVAEGNLIVLLGLLLSLGELMLVLEDDHIGQEGEPRVGRGRAQANVDGLGDLPKLQQNTESLTGQNHPRCVLAVVHEVQENNSLHEDICQNSADRGTDDILLLTPVGLKECQC